MKSFWMKSLFCVSLSLVITQVISSTPENLQDVQVGEQTKHKWFQWFLDPKKSDEKKFNWLERMTLKASNLAKSSSKLMQSSVFLLSGTVTIFFLIRNLFKSPQDAAKDSGLLKKLLLEEAKADALKFQTMTPKPTHSSKLVRFIGQNYYAIVVLLIFFNLCLVIFLFRAKFNSSKSTSPSELASSKSRPQRKRRKKFKKNRNRNNDQT